MATFELKQQHPYRIHHHHHQPKSQHNEHGQHQFHSQSSLESAGAKSLSKYDRRLASTTQQQAAASDRFDISAAPSRVSSSRRTEKHPNEMIDIFLSQSVHAPAPQHHQSQQHHHQQQQSSFSGIHQSEMAPADWSLALVRSSSSGLGCDGGHGGGSEPDCARRPPHQAAQNQIHQARDNCNTIGRQQQQQHSQFENDLTPLVMNCIPIVFAIRSISAQPS